jgi:cellulose synthase/poly-beta-1,6-N-acetylglucosamine synthase-like glycosyltransferase
MEIKKDKKISIIIPISDGLIFLKKTLPAILRLDYPNYEVFVADNGCNKEVGEFIKKYQQVKYIKTKPNSKTIASNVAAQKASGDFLFFLDVDALINDEKLLSKLISLSSEDVCYAVKYKNIHTGKFGRGGKLFLFTRFLKNFFIKREGNNLIDYPHGIAFFISKRLWSEIGGYDEKISFGCEEIDLGFKIKKSGAICKLFEDSFIIDLGNPQGRVINNKRKIYFSSQKSYLMIRGKLLFIKKYYSFLDRIVAISWLLPIHLIFSIINSFKTKNSQYFLGVLNAYFGKNDKFIKK